MFTKSIFVGKWVKRSLKQESTKERYLYEALKLFAERGYGAVSTRDIAKAVGCVPSALYKHYEGKKQLYDEIVAESMRGYEEAMQRLKVDFSKHPEQREKYLAITEEEQIQAAQGLLLHALHNEWANAFRKLMTLEQFSNPELAKMYDQRYITIQYEQHRALFQMLMDAGKMKKADPYVLAVMYISPITIMIGMCDREPEKEAWALETIKKHVIEFNKNYRIRED